MRRPTVEAVPVVPQLTAVPVEGLPLAQPGDDLPELILAAMAATGLALVDGDIVVVTGKVVSKAEGRFVELATLTPSERALRLAEATGKEPELVELVLRESSDVVRSRLGVLLVRHRHGWVSAMAGIDRSNIDGSDHRALLLPEDPDASAAAIRAALGERTGVDVGVVITDSHGRPFRVGNVGVALGVAGLPALRELEGRPDLHGRLLTAASVVPIGDLVACTAMLVSGEADEGLPVVLVRGLRFDGEAPGRGADLIRPAERDMFATPQLEP